MSGWSDSQVLQVALEMRPQGQLGLSVKNMVISYKYPSLWTDNAQTLNELYYQHSWCFVFSRRFALYTGRHQEGLWIFVSLV